MMKPILIGNTFPFRLIRRHLTVEPVPLDELRRAVAGRRIVSFWGHDNTLQAASEAAGFDLSPAAARSVLTLSEDGLPSLGGEVFSECWVLSPDCRRSFRPSVGDEIRTCEICSWRCLHLVWQ